jgi:predicted acylesterase/phospholipase RssA
MSRTALVLSGGGLFGAWQVGAWSVLERHLKPDVVIGCSIGSLNAWAIAGGATADELAAWWRRAAAEGRLRLRVPRNPLDGLLDVHQVDRWIRELHAAFEPKVECRVVLTELFRLKPRMVGGSHITWQHLAASCALLGLLPQRRVAGRVYSDGGLLGALPLWAARECGATFTIGLNVMPRMPWLVRATLRPLRALRGSAGGPRSNTVVLAPSRSLGPWKQGIVFEPGQIERWIDLGRRDMETAFAQETFPHENVLRHNGVSGSAHA